MGPAPLPDGEPPAPPAGAPARGTPLPVPELPGSGRAGPPTGPARPGGAVAPPLGAAGTGGSTDRPPPDDGPATDDDRQRFGVLLDRALERGLLDPVEYQRRLGALAGATTVEELRDLVTELPALRAGLDRGAPGRPLPGGLAALGRPRYGATAARRSPWPVLVVVLVVLAVLVVVLAVVGAHLARTHRGSAPSRPAPRAVTVAVDAAPQGAPPPLSPGRP